ncbi:hypothetical protein [Paenibacillus qinlingensis]|uniref:hypothetical protein n=1 Tax=Paenibacillus qinlingensis TaxID=1837343 RepID=UPI0015665D67|nr:hypothetical protein [Paenibacillus qinlingensis]NQX60007.1 hypothetical protein [Paenibacillus qinlingensis]
MLSFTKTASLSILLALTLTTASGCGLGEKASEKAAEKLIEQSTGLKVNQEGDGVTISSEKGEVKLNGEAKELPKGFPLSAFPGSQIESSMVTNTNEGKNYIVALTSSKSINELATYYENALKEKGIKPERTDLKEDEGDALNSVFLNGKSDSLNITVQIVKNEKEKNKESNQLNLMVTQLK